MIKKRQKRKPIKHFHIWDIPRKYFPRKTKATNYAEDLMRLTADLWGTNRRLQYSARICEFNIKSINQKFGIQPEPPEVFKEIEEFIYHYENYYNLSMQSFLLDMMKDKYG